MLGVAASLVPAATTIDRIVTVVGRRAIKQSDVERDVRVTEFLNQEPLDLSMVKQKKALDRLIDQELIRSDMAMAGNTGHLENEAKGLLDQILRDRFANSKQRLEVELRRHGLNESQLMQQLQWQLVVLRFIDLRFRPGVVVSDDEVRKYYDEHLPQLNKSPGTHTFEALSPKIREDLEGEQINRNFEDWLAQTRKAATIEYKVDSFK